VLALLCCSGGGWWQPVRHGQAALAPRWVGGLLESAAAAGREHTVGPKARRSRATKAPPTAQSPRPHSPPKLRCSGHVWWFRPRKDLNQHPSPMRAGERRTDRRPRHRQTARVSTRDSPHRPAGCCSPRATRAPSGRLHAGWALRCAPIHRFALARPAGHERGAAAELWQRERRPLPGTLRHQLHRRPRALKRANGPCRSF